METRANFGTRVILKAVLNIIDVIAYKLLGMDVWEQAEIDRTMVETPDGTKNERCWSGANSSANATLAIWTKVCRAGAAGGVVFFYTYISRSAGKPTDKFRMPVSSFNVISGESHAGSLLASPEFLLVLTEAGSVAEDMIIDTEVYHLLKFGHQRRTYGWMCAMLVTRQGFSPSVQFNNETSNSFAESLELDQGVLPRCE